MRTANTMLYTKAAMAGKLGSGDDIAIDGYTYFVRYGYAEDLYTMISLMDISNRSELLFQPNRSTISHKSAKDPDNCMARYFWATGARPPDYKVETSGC